MEWEIINNKDGAQFYQRCRVPFGWIVECTTNVMHVFPDGRFDNGWDWRVGITFVFDPFHWWK